MPKVQFIKDWTVKQGDGKGPVYKPGDVVELEASYAKKYKARGLAIDYVEPPVKPAPVERPAADASGAAPLLGQQDTSSARPTITGFKRR